MAHLDPDISVGTANNPSMPKLARSRPAISPRERLDSSSDVSPEARSGPAWHPIPAHTPMLASAILQALTALLLPASGLAAVISAPTSADGEVENPHFTWGLDTVNVIDVKSLKAFNKQHPNFDHLVLRGYHEGYGTTGGQIDPNFLLNYNNTISSNSFALRNIDVIWFPCSGKQKVKCKRYSEQAYLAGNRYRHWLGGPQLGSQYTESEPEASERYGTGPQQAISKFWHPHQLWGLGENLWKPRGQAQAHQVRFAHSSVVQIMGSRG